MTNKVKGKVRYHCVDCSYIKIYTYHHFNNKEPDGWSPLFSRGYFEGWCCSECYRKREIYDVFK